MRRSLTASVVVVLVATCFATSDARAGQSDVNATFVENAIKAFAPAPGSVEQFRADEWQNMVDQVRIAENAIKAAKTELAAGKIDQITYDAKVAAGMDLIKRFVDQASEFSVELVEAGKVSDLPQVKKILGTLVSVARQEELMGVHSAAADKLNTIFDAFANGFARNCLGQKYTAEFVISLQRQIELVGKDIDVSRCIAPLMAAAKRWLLEFEVAIKSGQSAFGTQDDSDEYDQDVSESSRRIDSKVKGTALLSERIPLGPTGIVMWMNEKPRTLDMQVKVDDLQSSFNKEFGEGDSWQAVRRTIHIRGSGQGEVEGQVMLEMKADGTTNVGIPVWVNVPGESSRDEKEVWTQTEYGFGDKEVDKTGGSRASFVSLHPIVRVPGLLDGFLRHAESIQLDWGMGAGSFDSGWIIVEPKGGPLMEVRVFYMLTPR